MQMYREYLADLGTQFGDHPVRDWFWERVPDASSAAHFVATMGMGFEGGNLDHALRFVGLLHAVGDQQGAALQETIYEEGIRTFVSRSSGFSGSPANSSSRRGCAICHRRSRRW